MNGLIRRYRALTLWNKIGFWGAIASLLGLVSVLLPFLQSFSWTEKNSSAGIHNQANEESRSAQSQGGPAPAIHVGASGPVNITTGARSPVVTDTKSGDVSITYDK